MMFSAEGRVSTRISGSRASQTTGPWPLKESLFGQPVREYIRPSSPYGSAGTLYSQLILLTDGSVSGVSVRVPNESRRRWNGEVPDSKQSEQQNNASKVIMYR